MLRTPALIGNDISTDISVEVCSAYSVGEIISSHSSTSGVNLDVVEIKKKYSISYSRIMLRLISEKCPIATSCGIDVMREENTFQFKVYSYNSYFEVELYKCFEI